MGPQENGVDWGDGRVRGIDFAANDIAVDDVAARARATLSLGTRSTRA